MIKYTRKEIYSEIRDPQPLYYPLEGSFWEFVRYYMIATLAMPWYGYLVMVAVLAVLAFVGELVVALMVCGLFVLLVVGKALYSAHTFHELVKVGTYVGFSEKGIGYWVPTGEQDEDGDVTIRYAVGSPWYELNEIKVFDSFVILKFVATSELGIIIMPFLPDYDYSDWSDNTLAFWKQNAQDAPSDQKDRRLIWFIIVIAIVALKFILRYLKAVN